MIGRRFVSPNVMAIAPSALSVFYEAVCLPETVMRDGVAVIPVRGPLMHHHDVWSDSYDDLQARVDTALSSSPKAIVLALDSPGGLVSGCFEAASEIRAACARAGVPLHAYVDGVAASAAYALACACSTITIPPSGIVGSIGCLEMLVDATAANAAMGVGIELVTSGQRKADGNPHTPITSESRSATQARVTQLAEVFFAHVAASRGVSVDAVRATEAALYVGASAVSAGLADSVMTLDQLVAALATTGAVGATKEGSMNKKEQARAALQAVLEDDESDEASKNAARAALAALDEKSEEEDKESAAPKEEASARVVSALSASAVATHAQGLEARLHALEASREQERKAALFASRPDLSEGTVKVLAAMPFADAEALVNSMPRSAPKPAATAVVQATRGGDPVGAPPAVSTIARAFGKGPKESPIRTEAHAVMFGVLTREAAAELAQKGRGR